MLKSKKISKPDSNKKIKRKPFNHKNRSFPRRRIQTLRQQQIIDRYKPIKFSKIPIPEIPHLPSQFQAYITKSSYLSYDSSSKLINISKQQFLDPQNQKQFNLSIAQHQLSEYSIPNLVNINMKSIYRINLWYYPKNRLTNYHYDSHDNFLYVLKGRKTIYLRKPGSLKCESVFSANSNQSIEKEANPQYRVVIKQGQCLYIPCGWFHKIYSTGKPIIAVNYWGNSISEIPRSLHQIYLKYLISQTTDKQLTKFIDKIVLQNRQLQQRKQQILNANIHQIQQLNLNTPFDFQILSQKLQTDNDNNLQMIWTVISYEEFEKNKKQMRQKIFIMYLQSIS